MAEIFCPVPHTIDLNIDLAWFTTGISGRNGKDPRHLNNGLYCIVSKVSTKIVYTERYSGNL